MTTSTPHDDYGDVPEFCTWVVSHGTDGAGSSRVPASFCGLVGPFWLIAEVRLPL
jgi:hypothetical protein